MDCAEVKECQIKFEQVLNAIHNPNFKLHNDVYFEMIITHLSGKYSQDYKDFTKAPNFIKWIGETCLMLENKQISNPKIASFTLKLLALMSDNEWQFNEIKEYKFIEKLQNAIQSNNKFQIPSVKMSHVQLLLVLSKHNSGLHWIKISKSWLACLEYSKENQTIYLEREIAKFIYTVLDKFCTLTNDYDLCDEILHNILSPLVDNFGTEDSADIVVVDESEVERELTPILSLVGYIFQKCIESDKRSRIAYLILVKHRFEVNLWRLTSLAHNIDFAGKIMRVHIMGNYTRLRSLDIPIEDDKTTDLTFNKFTISFFNYMNYCIARRSGRNIIMMAELNHVLWKSIGDHGPEEVILENQNIKFGDQVLLLQLLPLIYVIKAYEKKDKDDDEKEYLDKFCMKLFDISCGHTTRLLYGFRDMLTVSDINASELATKSIQGIISLQNSLGRDRAIIAFQAFMYILNEYLTCSHDGQASDGIPSHMHTRITTNLLIETPNLLSAILNGLYQLIKIYRITWKESIESTVLLNFMLGLLNDSNLSPRLAVQALNVTQISIEHFLAPNLALLLSNLTGSGMEHLCPTVFKRLHDINWEIRDSTLEVLHSMVEISDLKFPPFQQHIIDTNLPAVIVSMAKNDSEPYVRATALKCLAVMIRIKSYWETSLCSMDLMTHLISVFETESEGVVRRETITAIIAIYSFQNIQKNVLDKVFSALVYCACNDLYWEVKVNALRFWRKVMCRQFQHQGMIDGTFPTVTFSKEHKKIVTLNEKEILMRLKRVLHELSIRGCLGVFLECLEDENDVEVVKETIPIVEILMNYLNKYNYTVESVSPTEQNGKQQLPIFDTNYSELRSNISIAQEKPLDNNHATENIIVDEPMVPMTDEEADRIIDSIVDSDDLHLLSEQYRNNMSVRSDDNECDMGDVRPNKIPDNYCAKFAHVTGDVFLEKIQKIELGNLLKKRTEWMEKTESFPSLLEDILFSFGDCVNDSDCY